MQTKKQLEDYPRKDANGNLVIITFEKFIENCALSVKYKKEGKVLSIISDSGNPTTGLGGLGKTHETWNLLEYYQSKYYNVTGEYTLEVIDLSAEKDQPAVLEEVVNNLLMQLNYLFPEHKDKHFFQSFLDFKNQSTEVLPNTLPKLAWESFTEDLKALKKKLGSSLGSVNPVLLYFDSLDWLVDDELLKNRKTRPTLVDLEILRNQSSPKDSIFYWLTNKRGLFNTLLKFGFSIVVTGRYDLGNIAIKTQCNAITEGKIYETIRLGEFLLEDLKAYFIDRYFIDKDFFPDDILPDELLERILNISKHKPVLAVLVADFIITQFKKIKPEELKQKLNEKILDKISAFDASRYDDLIKLIIDQHYEVTGTYNASIILDAATLAFYRMDLDLAKAYVGCDVSDVYSEMGDLSVIKRYPHQKTGKALEFIRPHDDILIEFHRHYWGKVENPAEAYTSILRYYQDKKIWDSKNAKNEDKDTFRRRLELYYLTYLFEAVEDTKDEAKSKILERACRYAQYLFIENIDQHPDHAERILSRAEIYLPFEQINLAGEFKKSYQNIDESRFVVWLSLRRIEFWLTERNANTEKLAASRMKELAEYIKRCVDTPFQKHLLSVVDGYWGELYTWQNKLKKAKDKLDKTALNVFLQGDNNSLVWIRHLQGFLFNREADFNNSILFNTAAIETSLPFLMEKAKEYYQNTQKEGFGNKIFFATDEDKSYAFRRMLRVLLRSLGNLSAAHRYSGRPFLSVKYSYGQIYIWHAVPHADREIARAYANLLTAMNTLELEELIKSLGIYAGRSWLNKFEKDDLIQIRLIFSDALRLFKQGGLGNTHVFLPDPFLDEVKLLSKKEERNQDINAALEKVNEGLKVRLLGENTNAETLENRSLPREIADLYYLKGKIHLLRLEDQKPEFNQAEKAFNFASIVSRNAGFKYLELEALEALLNLCLLQKDYLKFDTYHKHLQAAMHDAPKYDNVLAKYHTTLGNKLFLEAIQLHDDYAKEIDIQRKIEETVQHFALMLDHFFAISQDHYDVGLKSLASRISDCKSPNLQRRLSQALLSALQTTQAIKHDRHLELYVVGVSKREKLHSNAYSEKQKLTIVDELVKLQRRFNQRGTLRKSIEINRVIIDYYREAINIDPSEQKIVPLIRAYFRFANLFQLLNQGRKASGALKQARKYIAENFLEGGEPLETFTAALSIAEVTTKYRTNEFWIMERYLRGEEIHYRERHVDSQVYISELLVAINHFADYLIKNPDYLDDFQRILAEGCFRLGELFLLLEGPGKTDHQDGVLITTLFKKLQSILKGKAYSVAHIQERIKNGSSPFFEYARTLAAASRDIYRQVDILQGIYNYWYFNNTLSFNSPELRQLSNSIKALSLSFPTLVRLFLERLCDPDPAKMREKIAIFFDELKTEKQPKIEKEIFSIFGQLPNDNKSSEDWKEWYRSLGSDNERVKLKEDLAHCVRFFPELEKHILDRSAYDHSFVFAKHKLTLGNVIFSKYFIPVEETYQQITEQWLNDAKKSEGSLFLEECEFTDEGEKLFEEYKSAKIGKETVFGSDFRQMMWHYLEGLDALKSSNQHESFEFNQYLLEIQRRFLLMPVNEPIQALLVNIEAGLYQFPRLYKNQDILREILWTLKARYIGVCLQVIHKKNETAS